jgi:hypothetical protein
VAPTAPPLPRSPALETGHYRFFDPEGTHAEDLALFRAEADAIYDDVSGRAALAAPGAITAVIQTPAAGDCAARGVAFSGSERIGIFAAPGTAPAQLRAVLAHETVHILHFAATGGGVADPTLAEGFANWAILPYWSAWQGYGSFEEATRGYLAEGRFVPLDDPPPSCTIRDRDVIYNERASFVGYLLSTYGRDRFLEASATRARSTSSALEYVADYQGVYGKSFAQLASEWRAWVESGAVGP